MRAARPSDREEDSALVPQADVVVMADSFGKESTEPCRSIQTPCQTAQPKAAPAAWDQSCTYSIELRPPNTRPYPSACAHPPTATTLGAPITGALDVAITTDDIASVRQKNARGGSPADCRPSRPFTNSRRGGPYRPAALLRSFKDEGDGGYGERSPRLHARSTQPKHGPSSRSRTPPRTDWKTTATKDDANHTIHQQQHRKGHYPHQMAKNKSHSHADSAQPSSAQRECTRSRVVRDDPDDPDDLDDGTKTTTATTTRRRQSTPPRHVPGAADPNGEAPSLLAKCVAAAAADVADEHPVSWDGMAASMPLQRPWTWWCHNQCDPCDSYQSSRQSLLQQPSDSVESFWRVFNNIPLERLLLQHRLGKTPAAAANRPFQPGHTGFGNNLAIRTAAADQCRGPDGQDGQGGYVEQLQLLRCEGISMFEQGITPDWEHVRNALGSTIIFRCYSGLNNAETLWLWMLLALIGETAAESSHIVGARIIDRYTLVRIELWVDDDSDRLLETIGHWFNQHVIEPVAPRGSVTPFVIFRHNDSSRARHEPSPCHATQSSVDAASGHGSHSPRSQPRIKPKDRPQKPSRTKAGCAFSNGRRL